MSKLNIKVIQTCDEEKLLPSLMAIGTKYALTGRARETETETETSGQKEHDQPELDYHDHDKPKHPSSERAGR